MLMHLCNKDPLALETVQCSMARILTQPGFNAVSFIEWPFPLWFSLSRKGND